MNPSSAIALTSAALGRATALAASFAVAGETASVWASAGSAAIPINPSAIPTLVSCRILIPPRENANFKIVGDSPSLTGHVQPLTDLLLLFAGVKATRYCYKRAIECNKKHCILSIGHLSPL